VIEIETLKDNKWCTRESAINKKGKRNIDKEP
jgi:hypothetical protein